MKKRTKNDLLLIAGVLLVALLLALGYGLTRQQGGYAAVLQNGTEVARYSLDRDRRVPLGDTNVLVIREGAALMESATCPDQICVRHQPVSKVGQTIVCLPHKIVIKIVAPAKDGPDMVV